MPVARSADDIRMSVGRRKGQVSLGPAGDVHDARGGIDSDSKAFVISAPRKTGLHPEQSARRVVFREENIVPRARYGLGGAVNRTEGRAVGEGAGNKDILIPVEAHVECLIVAAPANLNRPAEGSVGTILHYDAVSASTRRKRRRTEGRSSGEICRDVFVVPAIEPYHTERIGAGAAELDCLPKWRRLGVHGPGTENGGAERCQQKKAEGKTERERAHLKVLLIRIEPIRIENRRHSHAGGIVYSLVTAAGSSPPDHSGMRLKKISDDPTLVSLVAPIIALPL